MASAEQSMQTKDSPSFAIRAIWFLFVGWWLSALVMLVAYGLLVTIILFPLGLMLINRVPFIYTLRRGYA